MTPTRRNNPSAFTLTELVLSMGIMVILVGATTSAVLMSSHALPDGRSPSDRLVRASDALDRMAGELFYATSIPDVSLNGVTFTVDDRNHGDPGPETISYDWSGTPGDPLTRQYNGGAVQQIVQGVEVFALTYELNAVTVEYPGDKVQSDRQDLMSYVTGPNLAADVVTSEKWWGEYFKPTFPPGTESWSVEDVYVQARQSGTADGRTSVQLRPTTMGNTPATAVLEAVTVEESTLPLPTDPFTWKMIGFSSVQNLPPDEGLCLVLITDDATASLELEYHSGAVDLPNAGLLQSTTGEEGWVLSSDKGLRFMVYGTYTTVGESSVVDTFEVTGIRMKLRAGEAPSVYAETEVQTPNGPTVANP